MDICELNVQTAEWEAIRCVDSALCIRTSAGVFMIEDCGGHVTISTETQITIAPKHSNQIAIKEPKE